MHGATIKIEGVEVEQVLDTSTVLLVWYRHLP